MNPVDHVSATTARQRRIMSAMLTPCSPTVVVTTSTLARLRPSPDMPYRDRKPVLSLPAGPVSCAEPRRPRTRSTNGMAWVFFHNDVRKNKINHFTVVLFTSASSPPPFLHPLILLSPPLIQYQPFFSIISAIYPIPLIIPYLTAGFCTLTGLGALLIT